MISNTSSYKQQLKASKSYREIREYEPNHSDENTENSSIDGDADHAAKSQANSRDRYRGARPKSTEYRAARGDRRGGFRGRGNASTRRGDRDGLDGNFYILNRKYQDGLRHSETSGSYHGKIYEADKKTEIKLNLPEDTRISKLLRRLSTETDQENSLAISQKLLQVLFLPDNSLYVRKSFHILGESMFEILQVAPGALAKQQAARALGRMGYILGQERDFDRYQNWLFSKMKQFDEIQILLMKSIKETLALEKEKPVLQDHAEVLIQKLVACIEITESAAVFKIILDVLLTTVELYPDCFYCQFQDTVDLLFGWHVDHTQPLQTIEYISTNLQRLAPHFKVNLEFAVSLIENFLEDISNYANQLTDNVDTNSIEHVTVLILALNTVLKCLGSSFRPSNKHVSHDFISLIFNQVLKTAKDAMGDCVPDNLIIASNESIGILLGLFETKTQSLSSSVYSLVDMELASAPEFSDATLVSMFLLIVKIIKELSANLPIELIDKLIGPRSQIAKLRNSPFKNIREAVICVYQALLNLKNVSLLQEAYRYMLGDLQTSYRVIVPDTPTFVPNNPFESFPTRGGEELTVLFLLRCLSQLANASSIIVMWALKPSILELVGLHLQPDKGCLGEHPALQYCLLYLLYSHCKCYNHFVSTSNLVAKKQDTVIFSLSEGLNFNDVATTSPNMGNFAIILDILHKALSIETSDEVTLLLLQWFNDILVNSESYLSTLYENEKFTQVTQSIVKCGYNFNPKIVLAVCENLNKLLSNKQLSWGHQFLVDVCDLCKLHLNSNQDDIRTSFSTLSLNIPWDVAILEFNKSNFVCNTNTKTASLRDNHSYMIWMAQHLHLSGTISGNVHPLQFKSVMDYLLKNEVVDDSHRLLEDTFLSSWPSTQNNKIMGLFHDMAINSRIVLNNWVTLECAEFCVNNKLRTPLGKPNETFTKIEGALNKLGNSLIAMKKGATIAGERQTFDTKRIRLLLQFVEHLEKCIYNAAEGCAISMQSPPKQVKSFFITNTNTCSEWLGRIRTVVVHVSLHAGDSSSALRHGQALLMDLVGACHTAGPEFERAAMMVTMALLNMKETESISGLYVWCKTVADRRFPYIKCAAEQAAKRYELAIEGYKAILRSEDENVSDGPKMESDTYQFIYDQIVVCYKELGNWTDMIDWYTSKTLPDNGRRYWFNVHEWNNFHKLFSAKLDGIKAFAELASWEYKSEPDSWSQYHEMSAIDNNLYGLGLSVAARPRDDLVAKLDADLERVQSSIRDNLSLAPSGYLRNLLITQYVNQGVKNVVFDQPPGTAFLVSEDFENAVQKIDGAVLKQIIWWCEHFGSIQQSSTPVHFCSNLRLDVIRRARKEKNFKLAYSEMYRFMKVKGLLLDSEEVHISDNFIQSVHVWNVETARAFSEIIKLSYSCNDLGHQHAFDLCAATSSAIFKQAELVGSTELRLISSKILLKLAKWLQINEDVCLNEIDSPLAKLLLVLPEIGLVQSTNSHLIPMNEMAVGKLLQFSIQQCGGLAKGWSAFGTWCYRWGRRIVDLNSDMCYALTEEDRVNVKMLLGTDIGATDLEKVYKILSQTRTNLDDEDIENHDINTSEMIQNQLRYVEGLHQAPEAILEDLVQIWSDVQKRVYAYYALSAEAYFKYLQFTTSSENTTKSTECTVISVTLRLLRLVVRYALELQNVLDQGLQTTPTQPWKVIIPQLFSRLNHPESYVRLRVSDLLCRIAEDAPHLITFPAVVGALEGGLKFDFSEISLPKDCLSQNNKHDDGAEDEDNNYDSDNEEPNSTAMQSCFKTMVDVLSKQDPETIAQVQSLVKELRRITLLWDELWLGTLAQHQTDISKRQQQLEYEIDKVNENPHLDAEEKASLIVEKHRIIMKPLVYVLEQLQAVTSVEAETPHEKMFQEKYLDKIKTVIEKLKNPERPERYQESLQPLRSLQKGFQQKFQLKASYSLKMQAISPVLASIKNTVIAMPGIANKARVTIAHVSNVVSILPTKTKPKKLVFYGSDGQTYSYLFKGLEDLHLDERIMQFLNIANTMMWHNSDLAGGDNSLYRARHYSVIPLGPRSGLISWVDGTTPVFALYKRWQQREAAKPFIKNNTPATPSVMRPSELFYNKLNPLLKEHGIKNVDNRKEWPLSVLKQVLTDLMAETPSDLLAKELWCNSVSASVWWQVVKRYSYSVAVMSILGYIIGLGDRHLDNVLVDLASGEVVHIDYNVCFEKGKTLRVPEKVPFRLTPNIREALGVSGVEGIFRLACENVLKTMRKGRETLLTLLEAFVYDPLIDWTVGGEVLAGTTFGGSATDANSKQSKKELEKEVTLSMFNVRCTEMKADWNNNKEEILESIPPLLEKLDTWMGYFKKNAHTEDYLQDLHQQMALVKEAEAHGANKHALYTLPARYQSYCKAKQALNTAKQDIDGILSDAEKHNIAYTRVLSLLDGQHLNTWMNKLDLINNIADANIFDLVREFLHNAGKNDIITQCELSENEMDQLFQMYNLAIRRCVQILQDYYAVLAQCPRTYVNNHRMQLFYNWCTYMLDARTVDSCDLVYENFRAFLEFGNAEQTLQCSYNLDVMYKETTNQINKLYDDLTKIRTQDSSANLDKMYAAARLGISDFLSSESCARNAFEFVIINELVLLNKHFLTLETTANRSGDLLIKLTSRDGDWFLDELVLNSTRVVELVNNLPADETTDDRFVKVCNGIRAANSVYKGLHELHFNFHTIILPESVKKIQSEEASVVQIIGDLGKLLTELGTPIPDLILQLEKMLPYLFMQMELNPSYELVLECVATFRNKFNLLVQGGSEAMNPGKMLLMGFNGLFDKLSHEMQSLIAILEKLDVPPAWRQLDQVKEAKDISAHIFNRKVNEILQDIFMLKRIHTITEFFGCALEMCHSNKGVPGAGVVYNDEQLVRPVRQFIADFISKQLLGITTEAVAYAVCFLLQHLGQDVTHEIEQKDIGAESKVPLDELCLKAWNYFLRQGVFTQNLVSQGSSFSANLKNAWEKVQEPKKIELKLAMLQSSALRIQNQLTVYNFMNEEVLSQLNVCSPIRKKFIMDLKSEMATLSTVAAKMAEAKERQAGLIENAHQRLNWAKGANPNVGEISAAFESAVAARDERFEHQKLMGSEVLNTCDTILHHEMLRTRCSETTAYDKLFLAALEKWRLACQYLSTQSDVTPMEENIMNLLGDELLQNPKWLHDASEVISDLIGLAQKKLEDEKVKQFTVSDSMNAVVEKFRDLYSEHCKLMTDVKGLLKTMAKIEESGAQVQHFMADYRLFVEHFAAFFEPFKKGTKTMADVQACLDHLKMVQRGAESLYEELLKLEWQRSRPLLMRQDCISQPPILKQESTSKGQQKNAYAVGVWRKVKNKLEGRDPDPGRKYTAQEQVDHVIREATNLDNLALLYEGWTPWV